MFKIEDGETFMLKINRLTFNVVFNYDIIRNSIKYQHTQSFV
jgi:hypothetical protein